MVLESILAALWLMLPAYFANMSAVPAGGGTPIDFGRTWRDGRRILGDSKTWRGLIGGTLAGVAIGVLQLWLLDQGIGSEIFPSFGAYPAALLAIFGLAFGALFGDIAESFLKRRLNRPPGSRWPVFDQYDFVAGSWLVAFALAPEWFISTFVADGKYLIIVIILILSPLLHVSVNYIGYKLGQKDVPW